MLGTLMALVPSVGAAPLPSRRVAVAKPGPFTVLWTQNNPTGWAIPMRLGRDRSKPSLWGDGYDNFGLAHVRKGHVGDGKNWHSDALMVAQVRRAVEKPNGIFPDQYTPYFTHYVRCDEYAALGLRVRVTVEVVVDTRVLPDRLPLGIKTAWQKVEFF
jgi:hypothetical protein